MIADFRKNESRNYLRLLVSLASREPLEEKSEAESLTDRELDSLIKFARAELAKFERGEGQN